MPLILVADDNADNRYMLEVLLQKNGFETVLAANGKEALDAAFLRRPDLIISDILMPVMDGFTLCRQLKSDGEVGRIPFVFYTATYTEPKDMELGLSLGADRFLIKPQEIDVLLQVFQDLLKAKGAAKSDLVERSLEEEMAVLRRYNETLFHKLEKKMADLETANAALQDEITRRQSTEADLRKGERRLQALLDMLPIGLAWGDEKGRIHYANLKFTELFGYGVEDITTMESLFQHASPDPREQKPLLASWIEAMETARLSGKGAPFFDVRMACKDGSFCDVSVLCAVVGDLYLAMFTDITERKRLQEHLLQAQKLESIGNLAGGIAHDFNNVLTAVTGFSGLLQIKMRSTDPLLTYVNELARAGMRGAALTHQLLAFGRKQILDVQAVDLNETIANLQKMLKRLIREDISLFFAPCAGPLRVLADVNQIGQVVINLVTNARDAMPGGGSLTVSTRMAQIDDGYVKRHGYGEAGTYALLSVSDTGVGIDAKTREKVFEPFFTTKEEGRGTGLGLAVVYGIVRQHRGMVEVESEPGRGSRFDIYLPLLMGEIEADEKPAATVDPWAGGSERVLIAEDDEMIRNLAGDILTSRGYSVILAKDGEAAVSVFEERSREIDLVVLDLVMPRKGGFEAYQTMVERMPRTKVLFVTGYSESEVKGGELKKRSLPLLMKPYTPADLLKRVREVLDGTARSEPAV